MKCVNKRIGRLLFLYEFDKLSETDRHKFEAHVLECDYCFQSLHSLAPVVTLMRREKEAFASDLLPAPEGRGAEKNAWIRRLFPKPTGGWRWIFNPAFGLALVAAIIVLVVYPQMTTQMSYADLADIKPVHYVASATKSQAAQDTIARLHQESMAAFAANDFVTAIEKLVQLNSRKENDPETIFYLGLSYLLDGNVEEAITYLEYVIQLEAKPFLEKAHWFLGNAYLLKEQGEIALQHFQTVVSLDGEYFWQAQDIIKKINALLERKDEK